MEQFEQLLTCAICLDRYRNPKLLPCQHSFCMEPCMDGLVDYVRRQVGSVTSANCTSEFKEFRNHFVPILYVPLATYSFVATQDRSELT